MTCGCRAPLSFAASANQSATCRWQVNTIILVLIRKFRERARRSRSSARIEVHQSFIDDHRQPLRALAQFSD